MGVGFIYLSGDDYLLYSDLSIISYPDSSPSLKKNIQYEVTEMAQWVRVLTGQARGSQVDPQNPFKQKKKEKEKKS